MKQTRLLEIIREEISAALTEVNNVLVTNKKGETTTMPFNTPDEKKTVANLKADSNITNIKTTSGQNIKEEEQLNEMAWDIVIAQPDKLSKLQDKLKDSTKKGEQKLAKALEIIQNTKKEGKPIRQRDIANEMGLIQQQINPLINQLIDVGILEKGESVKGVTKKKITDKPQGKPAKAAVAPKAKAAMAPKAEPMDDVDDEGNKIEIDTTIKTPTGDKTIEDKLKSVIAAKKTKLKAAKKGSPEFEKELTALTQFLNGKEISKYIKKKSVEGSNPYLISNILKDIE
jgi:hypothetical protein